MTSHQKFRSSCLLVKFNYLSSSGTYENFGILIRADTCRLGCHTHNFSHFQIVGFHLSQSPTSNLPDCHKTVSTSGNQLCSTIACPKAVYLALVGFLPFLNAATVPTNQLTAKCTRKQGWANTSLAQNCVSCLCTPPCAILGLQLSACPSEKSDFLNASGHQSVTGLVEAQTHD